MSVVARILLAVIALAVAIGHPATVNARNATASSVTASAGLAPVNWRQFRFDARHTGFNPFERVLDVANVPTLALEWEAQLGRLVFSSSPAVVGGVVYIGSSDGTLWAYPEQGCGAALCTSPLWKSVSLWQIVDSPTVSNGIVYVGSQTSYTSNDGRLNAFAAAGCGDAVCAPLWQGLAGKDSILDSSPAVADGVVYIGAYDGRLYAFGANGCGAATCTPLWVGATGGTIESSPTVSSGVVYIGSDDGYLYAFAAGGCGAYFCAPLWRGPLGSPAYSSTPALADGVVYIGSAHALSAFDAGAGFQAQVESSPTVANGVVYAGRNTGEVLAWSAEPCGSFVCDSIWRGPTGDQLVNSSPTVVRGKLYIGSADNLFPEDQQGRLYVFALP